jgi:hypothetical protein
MESKCQEGKYGCKYGGDLFEIYPKYWKGSTEDGEPIILKNEFPIYCINCKDRDFNFCLRYKDLICLNEQDPYNCKADLLHDKLRGIELSRKQTESMRNAFLKRNLPFKETY